MISYISALVKWFVKLRGFAQGVFAAGIGAGMMVIAPLSAKSLIIYGWRTTFVILGIACLVVFSISATLARKDPTEKGLLPYGITEHGDEDAIAGRATALAARRSLSLKEALRTRDLWLICGIKLTQMMVVFMVSAHLVNYAKDTGMSPASAAFLLTMVGGASIAGKVGMGYLADRAGSKRIIAGCAAVLLILMLWLSSPMDARGFRAFTIIYGLAYGGGFPILQVMIAETLGTAHMGKIAGFTNMGGAIGGILGPWLAGYIFDTTNSYSVAFMIAAGASLVTIMLVIPFAKGNRATTKAV